MSSALISSLHSHQNMFLFMKSLPASTLFHVHGDIIKEHAFYCPNTIPFLVGDWLGQLDGGDGGVPKHDPDVDVDEIQVGLAAKDMLAREPDLTLYRQLSHYTLQVIFSMMAVKMILGC